MNEHESDMQLLAQHIVQNLTPEQVRAIASFDAHTYSDFVDELFDAVQERAERTR